MKKWKLYCCNYVLDENKSKGEVEDKSAANLSHVGKAAYEVLRRKHYWYHHRLWNVTSGKVVGELHQTPKTGWKSITDPPDGHDDWFPKQMGEIIARTEIWCKFRFCRAAFHLSLQSHNLFLRHNL